SGQMTEKKGSELIKELRSADTRREIERTMPVESIIDTTREIVDEIVGGQPKVGLTSIKGMDNFLFAHGVDVATTAVTIGRKTGMKVDDLRRLARGAMLHDVGQAFAGESVDGKTGDLSADDINNLKKHTILGYE